MKVLKFMWSYKIVKDGLIVKMRLELEGKRMGNIDFIDLAQFEKELYGTTSYEFIKLDRTLRFLRVFKE
jgi:hypothetical protein